MRARGIPFLKGHGTENDFVVLPDPDRALDLTPEFVAAICDRRAGIGADGVLRVVRAAADPEGATMADTAHWFMDYRNADGSVAEMCGNGIRVFARYLLEAGLAGPGKLPVATRAGVIDVWIEDGEGTGPGGDITVDMGVPAIGGAGSASLGGRVFEGTRVSMGNPHLVLLTDTPVADLPVEVQPGFDPAEFPDGVNVEVVNVVDDGHLRMRVHERGSGETRSCGTGACAAVAAAAMARDLDAGAAPSDVRVDVPGGQLSVRWEGPGTAAYLTGPAVIVARGEWLG